mgnify:FL=1
MDIEQNKLHGQYIIEIYNYIETQRSLPNFGPDSRNSSRFCWIINASVRFSSKNRVLLAILVILGESQ